MRAAYYLAFGIISLSTAASGAALNATGKGAFWTSGASLDAGGEGLVANQAHWSATAGETLPEAVELHAIPKHPTYRYAVLNDYRVIVDASSREVVYVIR